MRGTHEEKSNIFLFFTASYDGDLPNRNWIGAVDLVALPDEPTGAAFGSYICMPRCVSVGRVHNMRRIIRVVATDVGKDWVRSDYGFASPRYSFVVRHRKTESPVATCGKLRFHAYFYGLFSVCSQWDFGHHLRR